MADQFQHQQPPLRPCAVDLRLVQQTLANWVEKHPGQRLSALLLGVTPEIAALDWPADSRLLAVERSQPMIERFWPGDVPGRRTVQRADWFEVDIPKASIDIVVGDGVLTALAFPTAYHEFARRMARWLKPDGLLTLRVFTWPETGDSLGAITEDLKAQRIPRFDILKWRLAMALQQNVGEGVALSDVFDAWQRVERENSPVIASCGWPPATIATIQLYAGRMTRYTFPTVSELDSALSPDLKQVSVTIPAYSFGHCCPTVVYRRASDSEERV